MTHEERVALWIGSAAGAAAVIKFGAPYIVRLWRRLSAIWRNPPITEDHGRRLGNVERKVDAVDEKVDLVAERKHLRRRLGRDEQWPTQ